MKLFKIRILRILTMVVVILKLSYSDEIDDIIFNNPLDLQGVTLSEATTIISEESGVNIVVEGKIKDKVIETHFLAGKTLGEVLNTLVLINSLKLTKISEKNYMIHEVVYGRGSLSGIVKLKGYNTGIDGVKVTLINSGSLSGYTDYGGKYVINNILPGNYIVKFEKKGFRKEGEFLSIKDGEINKVLDMSITRDGELIQSIMEKNIEQENKVYIESGEKITEKITLININSDEVKQILDKTLNSEIVVTSVPKLNIILLKGESNAVRVAKEISRELDEQLKQVRIAAQTLEITDSLFENLGFSWAYQSGSLKDSSSGSSEDNPIESNGSSIKTVKDPITGMVGTSMDFIRFFNDKNDFLNFSINMLKGTSDATVSAIPSILVVNGEVGRFDIIEETLVSYKTVSTSTGGDTQLNTEPITGEAGIILEVTPIIKKDNSILLKIAVEVSNFLGNPSTITSEGGYNPKISRKLSTIVTIDNGDTIFIGGMKSISSNNTNSKVPFLGDIPYIGEAFKTKGSNNKVKDLYIKLKVDVVNSKEAKKELDYKEFEVKKKNTM